MVLKYTLWSMEYKTFRAQKIKEIHTEKMSYNSGNFLAPKKTNKNFFFILFYVINKTSLGETGCESKLYYLLAA